MMKMNQEEKVKIGKHLYYESHVNPTLLFDSRAINFGIKGDSVYNQLVDKMSNDEINQLVN